MSATERRREILRAARSIFVEQGYAGANVRAIATAAGVTEAMVYRHFVSKDALFDEAVAGPLEAALRHQQELYTVPADSGATVRERSHVFVTEMMLAMKEIAPLLGAVLLSDRKRAFRFFSEHVTPALAAASDQTVRATAEWPSREFDPDLTIRIVWATSWFLAMEERINPGGWRPASEDLAKDLVDVLFDGIRKR